MLRSGLKLLSLPASSTGVSVSAISFCTYGPFCASFNSCSVKSVFSPESIDCIKEDG